MTAIKKLANNRKFKKLFASCMCLMIVACSMIPLASAVDGVTVDKTPVECATEVFNSMHSVLNFTTILEVIAVALAAALAIYLGWWAIRKVARMVLNAFSRGKVSV